MMDSQIGLLFKILYNKETNIFTTFKHEALLPLFEMKNINYGLGSNFDEHFISNINSLPVIILVDVFHLPYRHEYQKYHASHAVFLVSHDIAEKTVTIIDWYSPYFYKGIISIEDFILARTSDNPKDINPFSGFAINNYWYKIEKKDFTSNVLEIILINIDEMKTSSANEKKGVYTGCFAFKQIVDYMRKCLSSNEAPLSEICKHMHNELFVFYRASILANKYFEEAKKIFPDIIDLLISNFIKEIQSNLENLIFIC